MEYIMTKYYDNVSLTRKATVLCMRYTSPTMYHLLPPLPSRPIAKAPTVKYARKQIYYLNDILYLLLTIKWFKSSLLFSFCFQKKNEMQDYRPICYR